MNKESNNSIKELQLFSELLPAEHKREIIKVNTEYFDTTMKSLEKTMRGFYSVLGEVAQQGELLRSIQTSLIPLQENMRAILASVDIAGTALESILPLVETIQSSTLKTICSMQKTDMTESIKNALIALDYSKCIRIANEELKEKEIIAPNVSFFKNASLSKSMSGELEYPYGFKSMLKTLNSYSATTISDNIDIFYSVGSRGFYSNKNDAPFIVTTNELNTICDAKVLLDGNGEEFVSEDELMDFINILFDEPQFASVHPTARKIYNRILQLKEVQEELVIEFDREVYYHSRTREKNAIPYIMDEMSRAPVGVPKTGRYNQPGKSYYYFADTKEGAEKEVTKNKKDLITQTLQIKPISAVKLLDLSGKMKRGSIFLKYLRFEVNNDGCVNNMPREYLIPNFVSTCCKKAGFDGIKYYGGKDYCNYVTWSDRHFKGIRFV